MNDLPPFLQMFVRLFAALALGVWLQLLAARQPEKKTEKERPRAEQVIAETKAADATKPCDQPVLPETK
jgi:hypothetical protein